MATCKCGSPALSGSESCRSCWNRWWTSIVDSARRQRAAKKARLLAEASGRYVP